METIIVICLLVIISLLLKDKILINKNYEKRTAKQKDNPNLPDIMGQPKLKKSLSIPNPATERQMKNEGINHDNLDIENDENENIQIPQDDLEFFFSDMPDFEQEEEEWKKYGISGSDDGFAQGVTFEELSSVGMLLQKDKLGHSQKETAAALVQKIQGTELFTLLENSMESASRKIAELLDGSLSYEKKSGSSNLRKSDLNDFDIGEFL
jgi:hypothetical protein